VRKTIFFLFLSAILNAYFGLEALATNSQEQIQLPACFVKNEGQWDDGSLYRYQAGRFHVRFFNNRITYCAFKEKSSGKLFTDVVTGQQRHLDPELSAQVWNVHYLNTGNYNYNLKATETKNVGFVNQNTQSKILYPTLGSQLSIINLYPGVNAVFTEQNGVLKVDYRVEAGYEPQIAFSLDGFSNTHADKDGNIIMESAFGQIVDKIPGSYYLDGKQSALNVAYEQTGTNTFKIKIPENRDKNLPVLIDPFYIDYSTYFYGNSYVTAWTYIYDVDVDENNNSYITGVTYDKFPAKPGTYDTSLNGGSDAFLCKIPSGGGKPDYFIYVGGNATEYGYALATKENGDAFLTGYTLSSDYPVTSGVLESKIPSASTYTSYITGIKSDGTALIYSTYIKGYCWTIEVNESGQVYIAPYGNSTYPVTKDINPPGQVGGGTEANIIRLKNDGSAILNCVALIGVGSEYVYALSVDANNQVYAAGWTNSDNLPVTFGTKNFGGFYKGGGWDGFLFKVDSGFTRFLISKYIGTSGYDYISAIAVNDQEEIFIQGIAGANDLPAATNAFPGGSSTGWNGSSFIMRIYKNGAFPRWTTYITNNTYAWRQRISINTKDECVFAGSTTSNALPTTSDAYQKTLKGSYDGYVGKLSINGSFGYLSYFGSTGTDYFFAIQTRRIGCVSHILMGGWGSGNDYPTKNAWKSVVPNNTSYCGRLVKWRDTLKVDPIDFGPDVLNCDRNYRILDPGNPGGTFLWQDGSTLKYFIVQKPGKYWVTATYGCGNKTDTIIFKTVPSAKAYLKKDTLICNKYGIRLDAKNDTIKGIKYLWNTGDTTQQIFANATGKYLVAMWTPVCQWRYDSIQITKQYKPIRGIWQKDTLLCKPFTLKLRSGSDSISASYVWNTMDSVREINVTKAGLYNIAISNQCGSLQDSVSIDADSIPTISYKTDTLICDKDSFQITRKGFSRWTSVKWNDGSTDSSRKLSKAGIYTVNISNSCKSYTDTIKLQMGKIPKPFSLGNILWCDNYQLVQTVNDNSFANIRWSTGDTGRQLKIKDTGLITATAESICGTSSANFRVERGFSPIINLGSDTLICDAASWQIVPVSIKFLSQIQWENSSLANNRIVNAQGRYWATGTNNCGTVTDSVSIAFLNSPKVKAPSDRSFCDFVSPIPTLTANALGGPGQYTWNTGETGLSIKGNSAGLYIVTASNACGAYSDTVNIRVFASPKPDLGLDTAFCGLFSYPLTVGNGYQLVTWSNNSTANTITATQYGKYSVRVTDFNGCTGSDEMMIGSNCQLIWHVPTAFSPNGDGKNDVWGPTIKDVQELKIAIYNRWGEKIWENREGQTAWDGTLGNVMAADGVYTWIASFRSNFKPYYKSGVLTLMR
jgi:gliding motility-associated-like protein